MSGYENYTLSPVPWIKQMPEHWGLVRGKNLYQKMQRPTSDTDEVVTCFRDGTVTLRKNRRTTGFTECVVITAGKAFSLSLQNLEKRDANSQIGYQMPWQMEPFNSHIKKYASITASQLLLLQ